MIAKCFRFSCAFPHERFSKNSTRKGRGRRRILRVWGLGREPQQAWKAGAQRKVFANGAPYALLATFVERAIWRATCIACQICLSKIFSQFVRQNAPACHITLIERFFFIEKSSLGFWTFWAFLPYYLYERVFRKIFRQRWNKTGVPCHYNIIEGFQKILSPNSGLFRVSCPST